MNPAVLLDSHALLWLGSGAEMLPEAILAITIASIENQLFASHITLWEMGVAITKKRMESRPDLGGMTPSLWFTTTLDRVKAVALPISTEIALESARVPTIYGYGDPGDCFLIATAHVHNLSLITRDARILELTAREPNYLRVITC